MSKTIKDKNLLENAIKYSNINGISGSEEKVAQEIKKDLANIKGFEFERDNLGSLAVIKKSKLKDAPTISISCHMDEIGFMITSIDSKGFLKISPIGGWWGHVALAQKYVITTIDNKEIIGVTGSTPPHLLSGSAASNVLKIDQMFLDIGVDSKKEVEELGIQIGDMVTPYQETAFQTINENRIIGKGHDNRISVVAGIEIMKKIKDLNLDVNVIFVGTTQEEVGLRGARTSSFKWTPDVAFAIDVTFCYNTPGMKESDTKLGSGAALSIFDSYTIANKKLLKQVIDLAKDNKIKYTIDSMTGGGTDSGVIQLAKDGVKVMTISIPSRYMHSHVSMVDLLDVEVVVELVTNYIKDFNKNKLKELEYK